MKNKWTPETSIDNQSHYPKINTTIIEGFQIPASWFIADPDSDYWRVQNFLFRYPCRTCPFGESYNFYFLRPDVKCTYSVPTEIRYLDTCPYQKMYKQPVAEIIINEITEPEPTGSYLRKERNCGKQQNSKVSTSPFIVFPWNLYPRPPPLNQAPATGKNTYTMEDFEERTRYYPLGKDLKGSY